MNINAREPIFSTLFRLLLTIPPPAGMKWNLTGRRLLHWSKVPAASQPALFMQQAHQSSSQPTFGLPQWEMFAHLWIYFRVNASQTQDAPVPDTLINNFLDTVEQTLTTTANVPLQTLSSIPGVALHQQPYPDGVPGLLHAYIEGTVFWDAGIEDEQAVIIVPIKLIVGTRGEV